MAVEPTVRHYDTILSPVITEKATLLSEQNKVVFRVAGDASKDEIAAAVEALFKVNVTKVNTINVKGKTKRFRGIMGRRFRSSGHRFGCGSRRRVLELVRHESARTFSVCWPTTVGYRIEHAAAIGSCVIRPSPDSSLSRALATTTSRRVP